MTDAEIAALAELAERATPGPWWFDFDWSTGEMRPGVEAESAPVDKHYVFFAPFDASEPLTPRKEQPLNDCYFIAAANPSTIKRLIASHAALRADVERLKLEKDAAEMTSKVGWGAAKAYDDVASGKAIDPSIILDATNRLNEVRNYAPPCVTRNEIEQAFEIVREAMIANTERAEAAEASHAALRSENEELRAALDAIFAAHDAFNACPLTADEMLMAASAKRDDAIQAARALKETTDAV